MYKAKQFGESGHHAFNSADKRSLVRAKNDIAEAKEEAKALLTIHTPPFDRSPPTIVPTTRSLLAHNLVPSALASPRLASHSRLVDMKAGLTTDDVLAGGSTLVARATAFGSQSHSVS